MCHEVSNEAGEFMFENFTNKAKKFNKKTSAKTRNTLIQKATKLRNFSWFNKKNCQVKLIQINIVLNCTINN